MSRAIGVMILVIAGVAFVLGTESWADEGTPTPASLVTARREHDAAIKKTEEDFIKAQLAAKQKYLVAIEAERKTAIRAENLDAANAISAEKKAVEEEMRDLTSALSDGNHVEVSGHLKEPAEQTVDAKRGWQPVLHLRKGQVVHLTAQGKWRTYFPDQYACDAEGLPAGKDIYPLIDSMPAGALIGRLGNGVFLLGKAARIEAAEEGDLEVRMNKRDDYLHDVLGQLALTVKRGDASTADKTERQIK